LATGVSWQNGHNTVANRYGTRDVKYSLCVSKQWLVYLAKQNYTFERYFGIYSSMELNYGIYSSMELNYGIYSSMELNYGIYSSMELNYFFA
jgi:hypothetical protein